MRRRAAASAVAAIFLAHGAAAASGPPLVILPGLMGSALEARLNGTQPMPSILCTRDSKGEWLPVWADPSQLLPGGKECLFERLRLTYDPSTDTFGNLPGIEIRTAGADAGGVSSLLYHLQYDPMLNHLKKAFGYELGKSFFIEPYDWRLVGDLHARAENGGFFEKLRLQIESAVASNQGRKAVVVSHSLGCLNTLYFFHHHVSEEWRATYIQGWVALGGPWMGVPMTMLAYLGGYNLGAPTWLVPADYLRPMEVNAASSLWLSAHPDCYGSAPLAVTKSRNYSAADLKEVIKTIGATVNADMALEILKRPSLDLAALNRPPKNVPLLNVYSTGVDTATLFKYDQDVVEGFNKYPKTVGYGEGDGTVPAISASWPGQRWAQEPSAPVSSFAFKGIAHFNLIQDSRVHGLLQEYLSGLGPSLVV